MAIHKYKYSWRVGACSLCGLVILGAIGLIGPIMSRAAAVTSGTVTQSYNADPSVLSGMIVETKPHDPNTVVPLKSQDIRNMLGVIVPLNGAPIVLTPQTVSAQQVLVATSNRHQLLVDDQNGSIKTGDYLTISSLAGVGMEAGSEQSEVVGRADGNFDNKSSNVLGSVTLKDSLGHTKTVSIGSIPVDVYLAPNPLYQQFPSNLPGFVTRVANSLASKPVSPARIDLSAVVLIGTLLTSGVMFYSGVRNGIIAIGRNPLAKTVIKRSLGQTVIIGLIIFTAGVLAVYLILNLDLKWLN